VKMRIFVPCDSAAIAVGADDVVTALEQAAEKRGVAVQIIRTGSRGLCWLEPMVEVATLKGRAAYGPVTATDVPSLFEAMAHIRCGLVSPTKSPG
jgi:formate dehydrogenase iron-sulfur subunit